MNYLLYYHFILYYLTLSSKFTIHFLPKILTFFKIQRAFWERRSLCKDFSYHVLRDCHMVRDSWTPHIKDKDICKCKRVNGHHPLNFCVSWGWGHVYTSDMISLSCGCESLNLSLSLGGWREYIGRVYCFANCTTLTLITKVGKSSSSCGCVTMIVPKIIYLIFPVHFTSSVSPPVWDRNFMSLVQIYYNILYLFFLRDEKDKNNFFLTLKKNRDYGIGYSELASNHLSYTW